MDILIWSFIGTHLPSASRTGCLGQAWGQCKDYKGEQIKEKNRLLKVFGGDTCSPVCFKPESSSVLEVSSGLVLPVALGREVLSGS